MRLKNFIPTTIGIFGLAIIAGAVFADRLGLDPSAGWGRRRIALLMAGVGILLCIILYWRFTNRVQNQISRIRSIIANQPLIGRILKNQSLINLSGLLKTYWFTFPILIFVTLVYIWFISSGTWITWVSPTHLYADLARGFLKGHLYLPIKVSSNLLTSPDPYNSSLGLGLQGPLDVSYFQGKYYLYWGPVPALILVLLRPIISWRLGDLQLLFGFLTGVFVLQCLLALMIWDRFFKNFPKYILWLSLLLVGLVSPATFMLDSTRGARIYEAAITGGQFFLVSGFIVVLTVLDHPVSRWRLAVAGSLWALAIGTRLILALPIGIMVLMAGLWIIRANHRVFKKITVLIPLIIPLAVGMMCLGWYNWARFGSVTEAGYFYQMTAVPNFQEHYRELINPLFILQNLYNYFLYPFSVRSPFPFIYSDYGRLSAIFSFYPLPSIYFSQKVTGLVYTIPFLVFLLIFPIAYLYYQKKKRGVPVSPSTDDWHPLNWITLSLGANCLAVFGFLLSFFWAATRYLEDVMPALLMLTLIGFWQGYNFLINKPVWRRFYSIIGVVLILVSISMSTLVAFSVNDARFEVIRFLTSVR